MISLLFAAALALSVECGGQLALKSDDCHRDARVWAAAQAAALIERVVAVWPEAA